MSIERLVAAARAYRIPVPGQVLVNSVPGATLEQVGQAIEAGELVAEGTDVRPNPLRPAAGSFDASAAYRALVGHVGALDTAPEAVLVELARLGVATGAADAAEQWLGRALDAALVGGTTAAVAEQVVREGLVPVALPGLRDRMLWVLVEANRHAEVTPLLGPQDVVLKARMHLREGRASEAVEALRGRAEPHAAVVAGAAWLAQGRPDRALEVLPPRAWPAGPLELERRVLRARALLELSRAQEADAELRPLAALSDSAGEPRYLLHLHHGIAMQALRRCHLREAAAALGRLEGVLERVPGSRFADALDYAEALVAFYRGNASPLEAQLRRQADLGGDSTSVWKRARALVAMTRSELDAARAVLTALVREREYGVVTMLAHLDLIQGDADGAERWLARAASESAVHGDEALLFRRMLARQRGEPGPPGATSDNAWIATGHLLQSGLAALDDADAAAAGRCADEALALVRRHDLGGLAPEAWLLAADVAARSGEVSTALACLERADDRLGHPDAPPARLIAAARHALRGTLAPATELRRWAALRDHAALAVAMRGRTEPVEARAFLDGLSATLVAVGEAAFPAAAVAFRVTPEARTFQLPGGATVDLGRRRAARRVLEALVARRFAAPGASLSAEELFARGWPGEHALPSAANNRVHVTLSQLRATGLAGLVLNTPDGWMLDPEVPVVRVPAGSLSQP